MKSVVMIAYWFPPEGNAAVYRPLRFLRNLPACGWSGRVIAGDAPIERYDPDLLQQLPPGSDVIRVAGNDLWQALQKKRAARYASETETSAASSAAPSAARRPEPSPSRPTLRSQARAVVRKLESWWYHPDMQRPWVGRATKATVLACSQPRADVLWATGPPFSSFVVAERASRRTGVPYVLDFRTSWTIVPSPFEALRPWWAQYRDRRLLRRLLQKAQSVVFFYAAEAECFWRMYKDVLDVERIHVIPNGFDGDVEPFVPVDSPTLRILYTGTLSDYGYEGFLQALTTFVRRDPSRAQRVAVQFVGEREPALTERVGELGLTHVVSVQPPVSHAAVAELQRGAHALLMLERKPSHKGHELLAGAKLFGYLKAGKPILGIVPHGEAERILREVGVTTVADASSVDEIGRALETLYRSWQSGTLATLVPNPEACERYSGRAQSAALARALEGRPALQPFVPGTFDVAPSLKSEFVAAGWA